jgi:glycosyltransferase involved in cell wall biosynthesis
MIPTYNQANYLIKAVESALAQDYENLEIVVADDNSTDNTANLLKPYISNNAIKYRTNKINLGRVANYRKCLNEYTAAEWVINLDGDDYFTNPQFISQAIQAMQTHGINNILFYQGVHILKNNTSEKLSLPNISAEEICITSKEYFFNFFKRNCFSHMSTLYNRQAAIENDFYQLNILSTDIFSFLRLCLQSGDTNVIVSKNISGVWLQHDYNSTKTLSVPKHWKNFRLYIKLYRVAIEKGYNKTRSLKWLMISGYNYLSGYILKSIEIFRTK